MKTEEIIRILRKNRTELERYNVRNLWLFGSATRKELPGDLDFLVSFEREPDLNDFMGLKFLLEELFQKKVDLLSYRKCSDRFLSRIEDDLMNVA